VRDLALFNLAIDSKLRGCDVVSLKVEDIAPHGYAMERATVRQKKTGRPVRFEITEQSLRGRVSSPHEKTAWQLPLRRSPGQRAEPHHAAICKARLHLDGDDRPGREPVRDALFAPHEISNMMS
jgi:hypothetical protein